MNTNLAGRLTLIRHRRRLTLEDLARQSGLTKSYLSKVERGISAPSIATAVKLARALDLGIGELLGDGEPASAVCIDRQGARPPFRATGTAGYKFEAVAAERRFKQMEPFLMRPPQSLPRDVAFSEHDGEELIFVLSGKVEAIFLDHKIRLSKGDSVYFDSRLLHRLRSMGTRQAEVLVVINREIPRRPRSRGRGAAKQA